MSEKEEEKDNLIEDSKIRIEKGYRPGKQPGGLPKAGGYRPNGYKPKADEEPKVLPIIKPEDIERSDK